MAEERLRRTAIADEWSDIRKRSTLWGRGSKIVFGMQGVISWSGEVLPSMPAQPSEGTLKPKTKKGKCTCHLAYAQKNLADLHEQGKADVIMQPVAP